MNFLIIEDHNVTALGIEMLVKEYYAVNRIDKANDGGSANKLTCTHKYDVCFLDINLPNTDTNNLLHSVRSKQPDCKILVISNSPDAIYAMPYLRLGAHGYLNKSARPQDFKMAVDLILAGHIYIKESALRKDLNPKSQNIGEPFVKLTPREMELLQQILMGRSGNEISKILKIEQSTVATIKNRLMNKIGAKNMVELTRLAIENGLI
jgi:DNA-binding NarL/FixJ family response regulator